MEDFLTTIKNNILNFTFKDAIDILLVACIIYGLMRATSKTRASSVLKGLGVFVLVAVVCDLIGLTTVSWLLEYVGYKTLFPYAAIFVFASFLTMAFVRHGDNKVEGKKGLEAFDVED